MRGFFPGHTSFNEVWWPLQFFRSLSPSHGLSLSLSSFLFCGSLGTTSAQCRGPRTHSRRVMTSWPASRSVPVWRSSTPSSSASGAANGRTSLRRVRPHLTHSPSLTHSCPCCPTLELHYPEFIYISYTVYIHTQDQNGHDLCLGCVSCFYNYYIHIMF